MGFFRSQAMPRLVFVIFAIIILVNALPDALPNLVRFAKPPAVFAEQGTTASTGTHTVQPGDTLGIISQKTLGTSTRYQEIAVLNGLSNPDSIMVGQVLQIPGK